MRIAITGATGLVGTELTEKLSEKGYEMTRVVRSLRPDDDPEKVVRWNPELNQIESGKLEGLEVVIHLAGENVSSGRWTKAKKKRILGSRVKGTSLLSQTLAGLKQPPKLLLSASGIAYGHQPPDVKVDENSPRGQDFLSRVILEWEKATAPAQKAGIRVIHMRFGMVLSRKGGALAKMLPAFRMGVGGKIGDGKQMVSWVALEEVPLIVEHLIKEDSISGPVNMVGPQPVSNEEFTRQLGDALGRPAIFPLPAFAMRMIFGEMADALLLGGCHIIPRKLQESGYVFTYPDLKETLRHILKK
ncbi:TIGR01777 family oxidoreductase [Paenactinomyces guangxiensis]|uniref:TIGR01777 family protein n=1 Tax=Paenactinomyces guangxiensis TaxID=1490290 RepID=A0A7W1WPR7_9BACL|nr:TIGR01777 family oxidoreductase [Paenactinomyces guangxiensis]MBA4493646.1 TIGR01777 family protein [Paenactinomyces guangxiensis]MBH8590933.1 TIGR01777 family oxidoreductase [Paenactinomyces guangxiensis]